MNTIILLIFAVLPAIILLWFFEKQDKGKKEPRKLKFKIFGWGFLIAVFAVIIEINVEDLYMHLGINPGKTFWLYIFLSAFLTAAFVEEALKLWVVKTHIYRHKHFDEVMDGITYTIIASLGFATIENIFYVLEGGVAIAILRALLSVPAHALFSGVMGYYIGESKLAPSPSLRVKTLWKGFGFGVLYHGLFNFLLFTESTLIIFVVPLFVIMALHLKVKIRQAHFTDRVSKFQPKKITFLRIIKAFFASIFIVLGIGSIIGSIILNLDPESGYSKIDILYGLLFAIGLFALSYFIIKNPKKKKKI